MRKIKEENEENNSSNFVVNLLSKLGEKALKNHSKSNQYSNGLGFDNYRNP